MTNSRDTQELLPDAGQEMLRIFHTHPARTSLLQDFAFYEVRLRLFSEYPFANLIGYTASSHAKNTSPVRSRLPNQFTWLLHPLTATPICPCPPSIRSAATKSLRDAAQPQRACIPDAADDAYDADADANEYGHGHGVAVWHPAVTGDASECYAAS